MPEASACVEWRTPQHADQSRPHDTPASFKPTGALPYSDRMAVLRPGADNLEAKDG